MTTTTLQQIVHAVRITGCAHNGGAGGEHIIMGTEAQLCSFADMLLVSMSDAKGMAMFKRRVHVEQLMLDAANGKRAMPTQQELREWALHLCTPNSKEPA